MIKYYFASLNFIIKVFYTIVININVNTSTTIDELINSDTWNWILNGVGKAQLVQIARYDTVGHILKISSEKNNSGNK